MNKNNINKEVNLNDFDLEGFAHISHQAEESERSFVTRGDERLCCPRRYV